MGNCITKRKDPHPVSFDKKELEVMERTFNYYCDQYPECRRHQSLSARAFDEIFPENPRFGRKLFDFLQIYGRQDKYITKNTLFEFLEIMLKESFTTSNPDFKNFEKLELMTIISIESSAYLNDKEELKKLSVTYLQAIEVIYDLFTIHKSGQLSPPKNEQPIKAFVDSIFEHENGYLEWNHFISQLKSQLKGHNYYIKSYFAAKFMKREIKVYFNQMKPPVPILSSPSYILNSDFLFQLQMSANNTQLVGSNQLQLVYSSIVHPGGFATLAQSLISCNLPTLILMQHEHAYQDLHDKSQISRSHVFGAISNQRWFNTAESCGVNNDAIFQLYPKFKMCYARRERKAHKNYCFMNFNKDPNRPNGIGFGGTPDGQNCRIWIDEDFKENSYVNKDDTSYESGNLVDPHIKKLYINLIEVWGIVHPSDEDYDQGETQVQAFGLQENKQTLEVQTDTKILGGGNYYWTQEPQGPFYWQNDDTETESDGEVHPETFTEVVIKTTRVESQTINDEKSTKPNIRMDRIERIQRNQNIQKPEGTDRVQRAQRVERIERVARTERQVKDRSERAQKLRPDMPDNKLKISTETLQSGTYPISKASDAENVERKDIFEKGTLRNSYLAKVNENDGESQSSRPRRKLDAHQELLSRYSTHSEKPKAEIPATTKPALKESSSKFSQQRGQGPNPNTITTTQKTVTISQKTPEEIVEQLILARSMREPTSNQYQDNHSDLSRSSKAKTVDDVIRSHTLRQIQQNSKRQ